jgi:hypothetical protein
MATLMLIKAPPSAGIITSTKRTIKIYEDLHADKMKNELNAIKNISKITIFRMF